VRERRKRLVGRVVSDKMDKTVVVLVERTQRHPLYGKVIRKRKKFYAHDEENACREGDLVRIVESRPLSRLKRWVVEEILERAEEVTG
jgi:small subunit ribosomal protein S17